MEIKETICTKYDGRGRVVQRTRTVDVIDGRLSYDEMDERCESNGVHRASSKRIFEAIEDYYRTKEW